MSKISSSLVRVTLGGAAIAMLAGCEMMAPATGGSTSIVDSTDAKLVLGERMRGELTTQSRLNVKDGSRYETFRISLDEGSLVEIEVDGSLDGVVTLYDDQDELLAASSPLRFKVDETGDYAVVVSGIDASSYGPFNVRSGTLELNDKDALAAPDSATGWLQTESNVYPLTIATTGAYQIDMKSDDFDTMLVLEGPNGYRVEDDDGGSDYNASIGDMLEAGEYTLTATSYEAASGLYTIDITNLNIDIDDTDTLEVGSDISGWMRSGADVYSLTIEEEGVYQIDMRSTNVDSVLLLEGPDDFRAEDDDGGDNYNSRIAETLKPGVYQVTARSYEEEGGIYSLSVVRR